MKHARRNFLILLGSSLIVLPPAAIASSIEPILRDVRFILVEALVHADDLADRSNLMESIGRSALPILSSELQASQLDIPVALQWTDLVGVKNEHQVLYVRLRVDLDPAPQIAQDAIVGAVGMTFLRVGYERLQANVPLTLFVARQDGLMNQIDSAVREQFSVLVRILREYAYPQ